MQSPKFKFLEPDLNDTFDYALLAEEWKKRVRYQIRKQLIFDTIEFRDYLEDLPNLIERVRSEILSGTYEVRPAKRYLVEKSRGLCRQMTLVHPRDLLVLERLSRSTYFELKKKAPSKSAFFEPDDGDFKKGFQQKDIQYGSFASWKKFQAEVFGFADENEYIVVTDVANFYDFINFQHLRNIVSSLAKIREAVLDLLIHILNRLTWTPDFMPLSQTGMPQIETSATRVLANAMLYEVDRVCEDAAVSNYARFMDDIDVGTGSIASAKKIVRDIDLSLQSRQLRLNSSKTKILSRREAFEHFCIAENEYLSRIEAAAQAGKHKPLLSMIAQGKYKQWLKKDANGEPSKDSAFNRPNGSKIHKYVLRLIYDLGGKVPEGDLLWLIENNPGMRSTAFRYLANSNRNNTNLIHLKKMVDSSKFIDDAAYVDLAGFLLHARFRKTEKCTRIVRQLCSSMKDKSDIGLYCSMLVGSRFLFRAELLKLLRDNRSRIEGDFWLTRTSAGLAGRFMGNSLAWHKFHQYVGEYKSEGADRVLEFLRELANSSTLGQSRKSYLEAPNNSFPQKIYYPKVLSLLALSHNKINPLQRDKLLGAHAALMKDPYYKAMFA